MKTGLKVTKNTAALISREALNKGALFILLILIGRILGKEALGRYSLALIVSQIFFFGTELGLNTLIIREVSKERLLAGRFLVNIGILRIITGLFAILLIWLTVLVLGAKGEAAGAIYLCGISYFFVNITNLFTSLFRAFEKMELDLAVSFVKNIIFLPLAAWALFNSLGIIPIFSIFLISNIVALIFASLIFVKQIGRPSLLRADFNFCKTQLIQTSPLWLSQLFGIAYLKIAPLLLFKLKGEEAVGLYNAGFVIVDGFWVLAGCFVYSLFPILSRSSGTEAKKEYLNGLRFIFSTFLILAAAVIISARWLIPLFYGQKFIEIVPLFRLLAFVSILVALDTHNGMTIIAIGKQFLLPFINGIGLAANFVLNIFFILRFGYMGSGYALILSESLVFVLMITVLRKRLQTLR